MVTLLGIVGVLLFAAAFPRAADAAAWFITLFFIAPITLLAGGGTAYALNEGFGWGLSGATCFLGFGGAAALLVSYAVLKD